ncbi:hypothetical protein ACED66_05285 [Vibrio splendidus]|uniref:hypothetical protein n=1 Tax=Vibrio splendidus TaxID=29497 RepID=UPI0015E81C34|nr:hypothetical protein [Vibrio splendidus]
MLHITECKLHGYQAVLNQYGFISFPPEAIQRNKVRLSLEDLLLKVDMINEYDVL